MKKLSDKAKKLITDFSAAASNLAHQPTNPATTNTLKRGMR